MRTLRAWWRRALHLESQPPSPTYWVRGPGDRGHTWASGSSPRHAEALFADLGGYLKLAQRGTSWPDTTQSRAGDTEVMNEVEMATPEHELAGAAVGPR